MKTGECGVPGCWPSLDRSLSLSSPTLSLPRPFFLLIYVRHVGQSEGLPAGQPPLQPAGPAQGLRGPRGAGESRAVFANPASWPCLPSPAWRRPALLSGGKPSGLSGAGCQGRRGARGARQTPSPPRLHILETRSSVADVRAAQSD